VPWLFDEEAVDVLKFFTEQKCALMPYLFATAVKASETGVPVMRPMVLAYQDDPVCAYLDRQYMLGDNLLVAPVFNDEGKTETYLPGGAWTHWLTNKQEKGGRYISETNDYFSLPLWVRENSIIVTGKENKTVDYDYAGSPVLHVFDLDKASADIYGSDGKKRFTVCLEKIESEKKIIVTADGEHNGFKIIFRTENHEVDIPAGCESFEVEL